jgi:hypothetical protein
MPATIQVSELTDRVIFFLTRPGDNEGVTATEATGRHRPRLGIPRH